jgi:hypothetical protein
MVTGRDVIPRGCRNNMSLGACPMVLLSILANTRFAILFSESPASLPVRSASYEARWLDHPGAMIPQHKLHHSLRYWAVYNFERNDSAQCVYAEDVSQFGKEAITDLSHIRMFARVVFVWVKTIVRKDEGVAT